MAIAIPIIAIAVSAVSGFMSYEAGRRARSAAEDRAQAVREETAEATRRRGEEQRQERALARARAGASGVALTGTVSDYLSAIETEQARELAWMWRSGESRAQAELGEGDLAFMAGLGGALGHLGTAAGQTYGLGKQQGWWRPKSTGPVDYT